MRIAMAVLSLALFALPCCGEKAALEAGGTIKWHTSFPSALRIAREAGKPLMVDFYSDRCGWCVRLDKKTYTDPGVSKLADEFVSVKVDVSKEQALARTHQVTGLPTIIFMDKEGKTIHKIIGFRNPEPFRAEMQEALKKLRGN